MWIVSSVVVMVTSLVSAFEDEPDHQPGFVSTTLPQRLVIGGGVGGLSEEQAHCHGFVVAERDVAAGHRRKV